jgi:hypothetical protein
LLAGLDHTDEQMGIKTQRQNMLVMLKIGMLVILCALLAGCSRPLFPELEDGSTPPPPSVVSPPIYPGANKVADVTLDPRSNTPRREITLETNEAFDKVLEFYSDVLLKEGWRQDTDNTASFTFSGCPYYGFFIEAEEITAERTSVKLFISSTTCID